MPTILAADVGGTKTSVALFDSDQAGSAEKPRPLRRVSYPSDEFGGLAEVVAVFLEGTEIPPGGLAAACFGVAGPVLDDRCVTPNLPWTIEGAALAERFDIGRVELINDLVATGQGIPALDAGHVATLQAGDPPAEPHPVAIIAAGTGLGMAMLLPDENGWRVLPSEGGHASMAPHDAEEMALLRFALERHPGHVSLERVCSGPALPLIYDFVASRGELEPSPQVGRLIEGDLDLAPGVIAEAAQQGQCPVCARALDHFVAIYGAAAGDLVLTYLARGGIYLGGGIAPKLLWKLQDGTFLEAFRAKGRFAGLLETIPVRVVLEPDTALLGAARVAFGIASGSAA